MVIRPSYFLKMIISQEKKIFAYPKLFIQITDDLNNYPKVLQIIFSKIKKVIKKLSDFENLVLNLILV